MFETDNSQLQLQSSNKAQIFECTEVNACECILVNMEDSTQKHQGAEGLLPSAIRSFSVLESSESERRSHQV